MQKVCPKKPVFISFKCQIYRQNILLKKSNFYTFQFMQLVTCLLHDLELECLFLFKKRGHTTYFRIQKQVWKISCLCKNIIFCCKFWIRRCRLLIILDRLNQPELGFVEPAGSLRLQTPNQ